MKTNENHTTAGLCGTGWARRPNPRPGPVVLAEIILEMIGREQAGKTALKMALPRGPLQGAFATGLELTAANPLVMSQWMRDALETYRTLQRAPLGTTLDPVVTKYHLYEADTPRAVLQLREVVGQVLTHATPDSDPKLLERYHTYVGHLNGADVLVVVLSCPADSSPAELARFEADMQLYTAFLRLALQERTSPRPCAVILALTKIDGRFDNEQEARQALSDEELRTILGRLVRVAEGSEKVALGAIFPVSAFGFGTAVPHVAPLDNGQTPAPAGGQSELSFGEPVWTLKEDTLPMPFNLSGLVWWGLMAGLLLQPASAGGEELSRLAGLLTDDLAAMKAWFVPLNCRGGRVHK